MVIDKEKIKSMKWHEILDVDMDDLPSTRDDYLNRSIWSETKEERWIKHYRIVRSKYEELSKRYPYNSELFRAWCEYEKFNADNRKIKWPKSDFSEIVDIDEENRILKAQKIKGLIPCPNCKGKLRFIMSCRDNNNPISVICQKCRIERSYERNDFME